MNTNERSYQEFYQLYDSSTKESKEGMHKTCYQYFMDWPEENWRSPNCRLNMQITHKKKKKTYSIPLSFVINCAISYARSHHGSVDENAFFDKYKNYAEKISGFNIVKLESTFQKYLHFEKINSRERMMIDDYLRQFATSEEIALYQHAKEERRQRESVSNQSILEEKFKKYKDCFEVFSQYGIDSPEFLDLTKKYGVTIGTIRTYVLNYTKSALLSPEERQEALKQYRQILNQSKRKRQFNDGIDEELVTLSTKLISEFVQTNQNNVSSDNISPELESAAQILILHNPNLYEQYYKKITGEEFPLYSKIRSVMEQSKKKISEHVLFTADFALDCILELGQPMTELLPVAQTLLSPKDYNYFKALSNYYVNLLKANQQQYFATLDDFMSRRVEIRCARNQNNVPIPGTGVVITDKEKQAIVQLMENHHIPFCMILYNTAIRLYANGNLNLDVNSVPVKVYHSKRGNSTWHL